MNKHIYSIIALISLAAGAVGFYLINQSQQISAPEYALYYKEPRPLSAFSLTDELGLPFNNAQLLNKWSLLFFGYTSCPDVCPTTLQNLNFMYEDITAIAKNSQIVLVSVDPKRDTREKLNAYIGYFNADFKALHAEHDVLFPFARNLGLMYAITTKDDNSISEDENYWVDHSASLVLINPRGKITAIFRPEQTVGEIPTINNKRLLSDYTKIVALYK